MLYSLDRQRLESFKGVCKEQVYYHLSRLSLNNAYNCSVCLHTSHQPLRNFHSVPLLGWVLAPNSVGVEFLLLPDSLLFGPDNPTSFYYEL